MKKIIGLILCSDFTMKLQGQYQNVDLPSLSKGVRFLAQNGRYINNKNVRIQNHLDKSTYSNFKNADDSVLAFSKYFMQHFVNIHSDNSHLRTTTKTIEHLCFRLQMEVGY